MSNQTDGYLCPTCGHKCTCYDGYYDYGNSDHYDTDSSNDEQPPVQGSAQLEEQNKTGVPLSPQGAAEFKPSLRDEEKRLYASNIGIICYG